MKGFQSWHLIVGKESETLEVKGILSQNRLIWILEVDEDDDDNDEILTGYTCKQLILTVENHNEDCTLF